MTRIKCSVLDRNKEKVFSRIATRGVVKFFNVCNQEQKELETKIKVIAGNSERKRDKIMNSIDKGAFLDKLKEANDLSNEEIDEKEVKPSWIVLRDDFIMGNKMKDWDSDDEDEENASEEEKPKSVKLTQNNLKKKTTNGKTNKKMNKNKNI